MLMPYNLSLIGDGDLDFCIIFQYDTLTSKPRFESGIDGTVNEVLFFVRYLLKIFHTFIYIDMTGTAGTYATAVMIEMNVVVFCYFKD